MLITICIPAYNRVGPLKRLLDSIAVQTFRDFEVVVTDDSPGPEVRDLCTGYAGAFALRYYRNEPALGTPENWNEGIRRSEGEWIKLMHDDDWFSQKDSLEGFAAALAAHPDAAFIFSSYHNVYPDGRISRIGISQAQCRRLARHPALLFAGNLIGPPSCVLFKKEAGLFFDRRLKWLVDIAFYIRCLASSAPVYMSGALVNIGISETQVTQTAAGNRQVEIPESFIVLQETGLRSLRSPVVFDGWWRLIRNLGIRRMQEIRDAGYAGEVPRPIGAMIAWQRRIPRGWLKIGPVSKAVMLCCYIFTVSDL